VADGIDQPTVLYGDIDSQASIRTLQLYRLRERRTAPTIQRTVTFILDAACQQLFPGSELRVEFSYGRGVYCCLLGIDQELTPVAVDALEQRMRDMVAADLPITPHVFGLRNLIRKTRAMGRPAETNVAQYLRRDALKLYRLQGTDHLFYGRQLPSTGYVRAFRLVPEAPGFIMQVGPPGAPEKLLDTVSHPKLLHTMRRYADWLVDLELQDIGHLNRYIVQGRVQDLVQLCEARHVTVFVDAANQVANLPEDGRLVLVAGPSSSGKTTFAKRLAVQLRVLGLYPFALSLDDYFVDRELTPRGPDGDYDYESLDAIRLDLFNEHLHALLAGEPVHLPAFNFQTGTSRMREGLRLFDRQIRGYASREALLLGFETRTSSPVRIPRREDSLEHPEISGLFPCGEGAGYAGGIVSAAMDGLRVADAAAGVRS